MSTSTSVHWNHKLVNFTSVHCGHVTSLLFLPVLDPGTHSFLSLLCLSKDWGVEVDRFQSLWHFASWLLGNLFSCFSLASSNSTRPLSVQHPSWCTPYPLKVFILTTSGKFNSNCYLINNNLNHTLKWTGVLHVDILSPIQENLQVLAYTYFYPK